MVSVQRIAKVAGAALRRRLLAIRPVEQVLQELSAHPALDLRKLPLFGNGKGQHQRGLLDRHERQLLVVGRVIEHRDVAEDLVGGEDRRDQALPRHPDVGEGRHLDRPPLGLDLPQHPLNLGVEQDSLRGALALDGLLEQMEARVLDHDSALEQPGQRGADLLDALAVQHQLGETPVDVERALEAPVLGVDDPFQKRGHQVDELDVGSDREERNVQPVRLAHHLGRQLAEVRVGPHHKSRPIRICDSRDQPDLGLTIVLDRKAGREHEVARPRLDLGRLHRPHPLDRAVEAVGPGDQLDIRESAKAHRLANRRLGLGEIIGQDLTRGHDWSLVCGRRTSNPLRGLWREH